MRRKKVTILKNNRSKVKKCLLIVSLLLIILGVILFSIYFVNRQAIATVDKESLDAFFSKNEIETSETEENESNLIEYMAVIEIPSIDLMQGIPYLGKDNTVDRNIQIIEPLSLPDEPTGNFILASHSGTSAISYFKHLDKLTTGDDVYIYYENIKYHYEVADTYLVDKGNVSIRRDHSKSTITLITCDKKDDTKQLVVIAYLTNTEDY